ncbi:MAG: hypothetical protein AAGN15_03455 [Cyanobacteria bacterium J06581_3]
MSSPNSENPGCDRLDINDDRYKGEHPITGVRLLWQKAGWHPPDEDPIQKAPTL